MCLIINIHNTNLSLGAYYINFSISKGDFKKNNLEVLDNAYQAIGFEILSNEEGIGNAYKWNDSWGNFHFNTKIKIN